MKIKAINGLVVALVVILMFSSFAIAGTMDEGDDYETELALGYMEVAPTLDGEITINEWANAVSVDIDYEVADADSFTNDTVYLYFGNDADYLYIGMDFTFIVNGSDSMTFMFAIDEDNDDEYDEDTEQGAYGFSSSDGLDPFNGTVLSNKPLFWGKAFAESVNSDDEHLSWEFAIPIENIENGDHDIGDGVRFGFMSEMDEGDEEFAYPIDVVAMDDDSSDWAELTLAVTPIVAPEGYTAIDYALIMFGIGAIIVAILLIGYKDTIEKWIGAGNEKYVMIALALSLLMFVLAYLEYWYDWLGMLGL